MNNTFNVYMDCLKSEHILVAGSAGSGKSKVLDALIYSTFFLEKSPILYMIDPKRVDLKKWQKVKNLAKRVTEPTESVALLHDLLQVMETRYDVMETLDQEQTEERHIYLFIDEVADLLTDKATAKEAESCIKRLAALGRAAGIHVVMATQTILAEIIGTAITNNFTCRICLKVATASQSRCAVTVGGAERLPEHGFGLVSKGSEIKTYQLPMIDRESIAEIISKNI